MTRPDVDTSWGLASPLSLLMEEEGHGDQQAEEVLLLTFTSDLGFLESFALGPAQAAGARVSIIADAAMSTLDPRAARRAGRSYLPGLASTRGAFHPKLVVIAGRERATVAVGSGNATLAGWQANAELWTVLRATDGRCPTVFAGLAEWLRGLPSVVRLSQGAPEALQRSAALLDLHINQADELTDPELRLVSSLTGPIIDQLPSGPVDDLAVCAPFHDPGARALSRLVERLDPRRLLVAWQPGGTEIDGLAVEALVARIGGEIRMDTERRYRHGKLIEWAAEGRRWALTGSANLSGAALLSAIADGGNTELGLITPVHESLLPDGGAADTGTLGARRIRTSSAVRPSMVLLSATLTESGLNLLLGRPLEGPATIEVSHASDPPEVWSPAGTVPAGAVQHEITFTAVAGSRIRLCRRRDTDVTAAPGERLFSNEVPVVDPARVLNRPGTGRGYQRRAEPRDLFDQPALAEHFYADMASLAQSLPTQPAPPKASVAAATPSERSTSAALDWEEYLDRCAARVGTSLLRFGLGLPALPHGGDHLPDALPVSWIEEVDAGTEAALADDTAEAEDEEQGEDEDAERRAGVGAQVPDLSVRPEHERRRYRRWAGQLVDVGNTVGIAERMLVSRLLLWTVAGGAWNIGDLTWVPLLARATRLLADAEPPQTLEPQLGSLAAVTLSVLRSVAPRHEHTEQTLAYDSAAEAAAHLLIAASEEFVEEYRSLLSTAFGPAVSQAAVSALIEEIIAEDPIEDAIWALDSLGKDAHRHGDVLHLRSSAGNPVLAALAAVGAAEAATPVGAWAGRPGGKWALVIWARPDLFTVESSDGKVLWRHYVLTGLLTPSVLAHARDLEGAQPVRHGPLLNPIAEAVQLMRRLGLDAPAPPADCLTQ